jgi:hypothetical protein
METACVNIVPEFPIGSQLGFQFIASNELGYGYELMS